MWTPRVAGSRQSKLKGLSGFAHAAFGEHEGLATDKEGLLGEGSVRWPQHNRLCIVLISLLPPLLLPAQPAHSVQRLSHAITVAVKGGARLLVERLGAISGAIQ